MQTWMTDESFDQKKRVGLIIDVLKQGQKQGIINPNVRAGSLLDFMLGFIQRSFFMWIIRGKQGSLVDEANNLFEMVWQGMANPAIIRYISPKDLPANQEEI
jgi:hypothetical protein